MHVLSLPPAFVLSQDQTLKLDFRVNSGLVYLSSKDNRHSRFDEVHSTSIQLAPDRHSSKTFKNVDRRMSLNPQNNLSIIPARTNADHVSLSSSQIVKEHEQT